MRDRYFFDKRDWKRRFVRYAIIFAISFLPVVLFNMYVANSIKQQGWVIFIDCVIILIFVLIGNIIEKKMYERKEEHRNKLKKEQDELNKRKQKILEDSYKAKREEKKKEKINKSNQKDSSKETTEDNIIGESNED